MASGSRRHVFGEFFMSDAVGAGECVTTKNRSFVVRVRSMRVKRPDSGQGEDTVSGSLKNTH
jgi:hypothetical protein